MTAIGIDLGTSNSCVARLGIGGQPEILPSMQGERTLPSVVSFLRDATGRANVIVGAPARRQSVTNPRETIFGAKRLIGRRMDDRDVRRLASTLPYEVVPAPNGDAWVKVGDRVYSPQEVSAHVLEAVRALAESHLGRDAALEAVITVPAYFDDAQRQATKDAAEIAGLRVRRLINEPTAAALGYGVHREPSARFAVCDLGGGTFDVSILNVEDGVFEVLSTNGDNFLGGDDIDRRLVERLAQEIAEQHGLDVTSDPTALGRLRDEAEKIKWTLSEAGQSTIQIPYLGKVRGQVVNYLRILKRQELESFTADIVSRLEQPCRDAMNVAGLTPGEIDQVLLVGGMTRMPAVQRKIEQIFGRRATKNANPDETVAIGAATECAILNGTLGGVVLLDVTSRTLGLHVGQGRFAPVIPRNATLPTTGTRIVPTTKDGQRELAIEVYAGEAADVRRNRHLGTFVLTGLPDAPAGEVMVLVDFEVDVDGCLRVAARELTTGAQADVRMTATCGLSRSEVRALAAERRTM